MASSRAPYAPATDQIEPRWTESSAQRGGGQPVRDLRDVGEAERVQPVERLHRQQRELAGDPGEHAEPHRRSDGGQRQHVRGQRGGRELVEGLGHHGRRRHGRRHRDRGSLDERPADRPAGGIARHGGRQPPRPEQDPDHRGEAELPAGVAVRSRVDRERDRDGEQHRVPAGSGPVGQRGDQAGGSHHPRALDRGTRPRDRHVDRDQQQRPDQPGAQRQPEHRQQGPGQDAEQDHVLSADREQVGQVRSLEVLARPAVDPVVLAEDEASRQRRLPLGHPTPQRPLRPVCGCRPPTPRSRRGDRASSRSGRPAASSRSPAAADIPSARAPAARVRPPR